MATGNERAKFSVVFDDEGSTSKSDALADSLESLRTRISDGTDRIKDMASSLRNLRGSTTEIKAAKDELKAKINAEKDAISAAHLAIVKAGSSYDQLATRTRKLAKEQEDLKKKLETKALQDASERSRALGTAATAAGGPIASLKGKLDLLKDVAGGAGGKMGFLTLAMGGLIAVIAAMVVAVGAGALALARFVIQGANAARTANLLREAATGSATNAANLGTQVDALALKVHTSKDALNELAMSLAKNGIGGQQLVDTFNAVGQAAAAMGDQAGSKIRELVERGRLSQRFVLNPLELQGTGVAFDDIAKSLAKNMRVGVKEARAALAEGRVSLSDGAKALREAVEQKFGDINLRRMLDLNVLSEKFKEGLFSLTRDVKLDPLLGAMKRLSTLFSESTVTGATLKALVTGFGNALAKGLALATPYIEQFIKGFVIGILEVGIAFFKLRNALRETFGNTTLLKDVDGLKVALSAGKAVVWAFATTVALAAGAFVVIGAQIAFTISIIKGLGDATKSSYEFMRDLDWSGLGKSIVEGLVRGLKSNIGMVVDAVGGLAGAVTKTFTGKMDIHSPSGVAEEWGEATPAGYALGVRAKTPDAQAAVDAMVRAPSSSGAAAGGGGGGMRARPPVHVELTIQVSAGAGADGNAIAKDLAPTLRAQLVALLEEALAADGIPREAAPA